MAITTRYAVNMAMQYNETDISQFLINPSVGSRRFLTEAEQTRILRATETSALYFLTDVTGAGRSARYRWYDSGGTMLNEYLLDLTSAGVHNSIPIDWTSFYVPSGAVKLTVAIIGSANGFANGQFEIGSGNLFTSWTLTQPSRTNKLLQSESFNTTWTKTNLTITENAVIAPNGLTVADSLVPTAVNGSHNIQQLVATIAAVGTMYVYAKPNGYNWIAIENGGQVAYFNISTGTVGTVSAGTASIRLDNNGYYLCIFTCTAVNTKSNIYVASANSTITFTGNGTSGVYLWGSQFQLGSYATPYIPTTTAAVATSLGEFLQNTTGGPDGSRCMKLWVDTPTDITYFRQAVSIVSGSNYTIRFRARLIDTATTPVMNYRVNAGAWASAGTLTSAWQWLSVTFTGAATSSQNIDFKYTNAAYFGFAEIDDVSVSLTTPSELSEVRTYNLDDECVKYEYQLNWLNKLGGRDTWVFTGFPTITKDVTREGNLEYSRRTNFVSPKRIYGSRAIASRESVTLSHQCKDRATAEWLKSELIDSIDILVKVGSSYYPADIVGSSIVVSNTFSQDFTIRFTIRYAFDVNVQTR